MYVCTFIDMALAIKAYIIYILYNQRVRHRTNTAYKNCITGLFSGYFNIAMIAHSKCPLNVCFSYA